MAKSVYITSVSTFSGKTAFSLGIGLRMQAAGLKVSYLKPVSAQPYEAGGRVLDEDADFVRRTLGLETPPWELSPVVITEELLDQVLRGELKRDLMGEIKQAVQLAMEANDVVIMEGGASMREGYTVGLNTLSVIDALDTPAVSMVSVSEGCLSGMCLLDDAITAKRRLGDHLLGVVFNAAPRDQIPFIKQVAIPYLEREHNIRTFGVLPADPYLRALSVGEIVDALNAKILTGAHLRERLVEHMSVGAMSVEAALPRFRRQLNKAVFTGGDRTDIQAAALETSTTCLVLTGNLQPSATIIRRAEELKVAVLLVPDNTMEAVERIERISGRTSLAQPEKMSRFQAMLAEHIDYDGLIKAIGL